MSKRANEAALKAYPPKRKEVSMSGAIYTVVGGDFERRIYTEGYEQAEKDLTLTWQDCKRIVEIADAFAEYAEAGIIEPFLASEEAFYKEVLKRFRGE